MSEPLFIGVDLSSQPDFSAGQVAISREALAALPEVQAMIAESVVESLCGVTTLHMLIADIREATVGSRPMLSELASALVAWRDEAVKVERDACIALIEDHFPGQLYASNRTKAIAAIRKRGEGKP